MFSFRSLIIVLVLFFCKSTFAQINSSAPSLKISGEVTKPMILTVADLSKMKQTTATMKDRDGKPHTYTGVPVQQILEAAGATTGPQLKGDNLAKCLMVRCADGYEVLFSLAELDSSFTDRVVILSDSLEGKPLPLDKGPFRLVVPGEKKPARSCFQVTEFVVTFGRE